MIRSEYLFSVVIHLDLADLEDGILLRRTNSPAAVAVGPVVPEPRASDGGHILIGFKLHITVNEELHSSVGPVNTVLVLSPGGVRRGVNGLVGVFAVSVVVLVGEPDLAVTVVGVRVGVGKPLNVDFLVVVPVKEHAYSGKLLIPDLHPDGTVSFVSGGLYVPLQTPAGSVRIAVVRTLPYLILFSRV